MLKLNLISFDVRAMVINMMSGLLYRLRDSRDMDDLCGNFWIILNI